jgi:hypothetical protein
LSEDEITIYKAVLKQWAAGEQTSLNVSDETFPLDLAARLGGLADCDCVKDIYLENLSSASHSFHDLTPDVLLANMRLVNANEHSAIVRANDPGNTIAQGKTVSEAVKTAFDSGLFAMSEIAFDKEHRHAAVMYSFWCGSRCGQGGTFIFEKNSNGWKRLDRRCGGWIS